MKIRFSSLAISIVFIFSLACQTLTSEFATESDSSAPVDGDTSQTIDTTAFPWAGLIYTTRQWKEDYDKNTFERFQFGNDGKPNKIFEKEVRDIHFSDDASQVVYTDAFADYGYPCTWFADYKAKTVSQLGCRLDIKILGWLPDQPNKLLSIQNRDSTYPYGPLATISVPDGSVEVLNTATTTLWADVSPDGRNIVYNTKYDAYINYAEAWLYSFDSNTEVLFDPAKYGVSYSQIGNPAWSPDGKKIAWGLLGEYDSFDSAIGVFDLENNTGLVLHPFESGNFNPDMDYGPYPSSASWSPDGNWLVTDVCFRNENWGGDWANWCEPDLSGSWIINQNGQIEHRLDGNFLAWSPDSQWTLYKRSPENQTELWVSRPDGSEAVLLGSSIEGDYEFNPSWSMDSKYLAYNGAEHVLVAETESWQIRQFGDSTGYGKTAWSPDGAKLAFFDENYFIWLIEMDGWQLQQVAQMEVPDAYTDNSGFSRPPQISLDWQPVLFTPFETLTLLPINTPSSSASIPTNTPSPSSADDCTNNVIVTGKDTNKGDYLTICKDNQTYELGPLARGWYAVGPNNQFIVYCTNNGLVYAVKIGQTNLQPIGNVKDFSIIARGDEPKLSFEFSGDNPYKVTIRELTFNQTQIFTIPKNISTP